MVPCSAGWRIAPLLLAVFFCVLGPQSGNCRTRTARFEALRKVLMVKRANKSDLLAIVKLIEIGSQNGQVLTRSVEEIAQFVNSFFVYIENETVVGCAALDIYSKKLAEVRSLAVLPEYQNKGIGGKLIQRCVEEARTAGIYEVLAVTSSQRLFGKAGFRAKLSDNKKPLLIKL